MILWQVLQRPAEKFFLARASILIVTTHLAELERLIESGACLVKWLPSAQNIQPDHPRCFPFYDLLAKHKVPLLSHTGGEHTLKAFPDSLSDPRRWCRLWKEA